VGASVICVIAPLPPGTHLVADGDVIVHVTEDIEVCAAPSRCQHAAGRLGQPAGCVLTCSFHGWQLDASAMRYLSPHADVEQPRYRVEISAGMWTVLDRDPVAPWTERQPRRELIPGSFTAHFDGRGVRVAAGGSEISWPGSGRVHVWLPLIPGGRVMWIPGAERPLLLVEVAGNRLLLVHGALAEAPREVDLLVALGEGAEDWAGATLARAVVTDRPRAVRRQRRGVVVWKVAAGLTLDVATCRPT